LHQAQLAHRALDGVGVGGRRHDPQAHTERQQVAQGDGAARGHRVVERGVDPPQHAAPGQLGQQRINRVVQAQLALLDQDHRRRGDDGLRHRADAEDAVAADLHGQRATVAHRQRPQRVGVDLATAADQRDQPRHIAAVDVAGHHVVHALQPRLGQGPGHHGHQVVAASLAVPAIQGRDHVRTTDEIGPGMTDGTATD
jgi:hypothetical protein